MHGCLDLLFYRVDLGRCESLSANITRPAEHSFQGGQCIVQDVGEETMTGSSYEPVA